MIAVKSIMNLMLKMHFSWFMIAWPRNTQCAIIVPRDTGKISVFLWTHSRGRLMKKVQFLRHDKRAQTPWDQKGQAEQFQMLASIKYESIFSSYPSKIVLTKITTFKWAPDNPKRLKTNANLCLKDVDFVLIHHDFQFSRLTLYLRLFME